MLDDFDKTRLALGAAKRLHIPMGDKFLWRETADQLRGLATMLDHFSRLPETPELDEFTMHLRVMAQIDSINRIIRSTARQAGVDIKDGRQYTAEQRQDTGGTGSTDRGWKPQVLDYQGRQR